MLPQLLSLSGLLKSEASQENVMLTLNVESEM